MHSLDDVIAVILLVTQLLEEIGYLFYVHKVLVYLYIMLGNFIIDRKMWVVHQIQFGGVTELNSLCLQ